MKLKYSDPMINIRIFDDEDAITTNSSFTAGDVAKNQINGAISTEFGENVKIASDTIEWTW